MRDKVASLLKEDIEMLRKRSKNTPTGDFNHQFIQYDISSTKANILAYENFATNSQVLIKALSERKSKNSDDYLGMYIYEKNLIFASIGSPQLDTDIIFFYFDPKGDFNFGYNHGSGRVGGAIKLPFSSLDEYGVYSFDSFPDPNEFMINPDASPNNPKSYPYGGVTPGFTLRHEIAHAKFLNGSLFPNNSEYDTDMEAMRGIREAWNKWQASGKKDDSGYYFALRDNNGRYILT